MRSFLIMIWMNLNFWMGHLILWGLLKQLHLLHWGYLLRWTAIVHWRQAQVLESPFHQSSIQVGPTRRDTQCKAHQTRELQEVWIKLLRMISRLKREKVMRRTQNMQWRNRSQLRLSLEREDLNYNLSQSTVSHTERMRLRNFKKRAPLPPAAVPHLKKAHSPSPQKRTSLSQIVITLV
jgi:hypothetical protein